MSKIRVRAGEDLPRRVGAPRQFRWDYLTVMVSVATLETVSIPPGPKLTVPVGWKTDFDVPAAGVTLMITVMVEGGLAPFFLAPPSVGVVQTI